MPEPLMPEPLVDGAAPRPLWPALRRAIRGRCPRCGQGRLFQSYLKQTSDCPPCGEPLGHLRADDAPAWATIVVVGHVIVPAMLMVEMWSELPLWICMVMWPLLACAMALLLLPRAKGLFLGILWATRAPGSSEDWNPAAGQDAAASAAMHVRSSDTIS